MNIKDLRLFLISFLIFLILIFVTDLFYIEVKQESYDYENYIRDVDFYYHNVFGSGETFKELKDDEISFESGFDREAFFVDKGVDIAYEIDKIITKINTIPKVQYFYNPKSYEDIFSTDERFLLINNFILSDIFLGKNYDFITNYVEKRNGPRGMMKGGELFLYDPISLDKKETLSIFIHELGHYVDVFYLEDYIRDEFYNLSWLSTRNIKGGLDVGDFVSGYSMTNKYEDFAESFTYYILHNEHFYKKSKNSDILRDKYNFFSEYVFTRGQFKNTDFKTYNYPLEYYRDITKIDYFLEKLLKYIKN